MKKSRLVSLVDSKRMSGLVVALGLAMTGAAHADTINFSQFGADGTTLSSPLVGVTMGGVGVTLTSPNGSFTMYQEGNDWHGIFPSGAPILFDGEGAGAVDLSFASGLSSLTLAGQANAYGAYTETATAYSGNTVVDTVAANSFNYVTTNYPQYTGTVPFLTVTGTDITSVVFSTTNDSIGLALYGGAGATPAATPLPASALLMGSALVLGLLAMRRKNGFSNLV